MDIGIDIDIEECNTLKGLLKAFNSGYEGIFEAARNRRKLRNKHVELEEFVVGELLYFDKFGQIHAIHYRQGEAVEFPPITMKDRSGNVLRLNKTIAFPQVMTFKVFQQRAWKRVASFNHIGRLPNPETVCHHCGRKFEINDLKSMMVFDSCWQYPEEWEKKLYTDMVAELVSHKDSEYIFYHNPTAGIFVGDDKGLIVCEINFLHGNCYIEALFTGRQKQFENLLTQAGFKIKNVLFAPNNAGTLAIQGTWYKITTQYGDIVLGVEEANFIYIGLPKLFGEVKHLFDSCEFRTGSDGIYVSGADQAAEQLKKVFDYLLVSQT